MEALRPTSWDAPADGLVRVGRFATHDPCAHEQATAPWDHVITPLARGPYRQRVAFLASPGLILYREQIHTRARLQGLSPPGVIAFAVPVQVGGDTRFWGSTLHASGLPATMPDGVHADFSAGQTHLIGLIDLDLFRQVVSADLRDGIERAAHRHVLPAPPAAIARLGSALGALLDTAQARTDESYHRNAVRAMQCEVLDWFCQSLALPMTPPRRDLRRVRQRGLRKVIEYLRSADTALVTVADLCATASLSQRTLEYAFRETFGSSVQGFLHLRRYHAARRDLIAADGKTATVKAIAQHNGFFQMGRFAVRYKALFGESPSQTLAESVSQTRCSLPRWQGSNLL